MSRILIALPMLAAAALAQAAGTAAPVSPQRTTVVANETQAISARFFDAQGRPSVGETVRFFNDACGTFPSGGFVGQAVTDATGLATIGFTALNVGFIRCTVSASAPVSGSSVSFDVITFRPEMSSITIATTTDPVEPRPGQPFRVTATPRFGQFPLFNVEVGARIVAGSASASLAASSFRSGQEGFVQFIVTPEGGAGDYEIEMTYLGKAVRVPVRAPANPYQDLWWSGLVENGWGMSIVQHRDVLFTNIYAYDAAGKPVWYVMPSGAWNAAHTAFTGEVFLPRGAPFSNYDVSRFDVGAPVGRATLTFDAANAASMDYEIQGHAGRKSLSRMFFGEGSASVVAGVGDLWWGGIAQNGWGLSVLQQGRDLFLLWFTYDEAGSATWFAMPAGSWVDARTFRGALYRSAGSSWLGKAYDATSFRMNEIGWYALQFHGDGGATFQYSMGGGAVATLPLTRIPF
jgi:hypothetical protein